MLSSASLLGAAVIVLKAAESEEDSVPEPERKLIKLGWYQSIG